MACYSFQCKKCQEPFDEICSYADYDAGFPDLRCPHCRSKKIGKMLTAGDVLWTQSKLQNFEIRAGVNMEKAKNERAAAEVAEKLKNPYRRIDDTNRGRRMNFVD